MNCEIEDCPQRSDLGKCNLNRLDKEKPLDKYDIPCHHRSFKLRMRDEDYR
jgi:hypothetical protein